MTHDVVSAPPPAWTAPESTRKTVTPLYGAHRTFGARFGRYAGITMPMRYVGELAEARAVHAAAGLFDLSYLGEVAVSGREAAQMLDYALAGHISSLEIGRARYALMCAEDGGIVEDLVVTRLDATEYLIISNTIDVESLLGELVTRGERFAVRVDDRTEDYAVVSVEGPRSAEVLSSLSSLNPRALQYFECVETTVAGRDGMIARTGYNGDEALEFYCAPDDAATVWYAIAEAGAPYGIQPVGLAARALLRLESGVPLTGREITSAVTPFDARLGKLVALDKDDFVGRAALVARAARPDRTVLFGLSAAGKRSPRPGQRVVDAGTGAALGSVTSGAYSPNLRHPIALAYLDVAELKQAGDLAVETAGQPIPVSLAPLPFRGRRRH